MAAARQMSTEPARHAAPEEVAMAFAALGAADYVRLGRAARLRGRGLPELDWRDLLQEAVERALSGSRRWPADVPFMAFLLETIRSIASEAWRRRNVSRLDLRDAANEDSLLSFADDAPSPDRAVVARDLVRRLHELFGDDPSARIILDGLAEGLTPAEIQARAGFSPTTYDSARRRMRRLIARTDLETP
jgi:RNA polymerase sigma-70 factor (ECF subfamily)